MTPAKGNRDNDRNSPDCYEGNKSRPHHSGTTGTPHENKEEITA